MAADAVFALFALFVAIALTTDATIGFGSMLIAVTLGAHLYPVATLLPVLVCQSVMLTMYMVVSNRHLVAWRVLLTRVLPGMFAGMALGYVVFSNADDEALRLFLGIFVTGVASVDLFRFIRQSGEPQAPMTTSRFSATTLAAGIVHGITATGGPILVYGMGRFGLSKGEFRSTLAAVWLTLNSTWVLVFLSNGRLGSFNAPFVAALVPVLVGSILAGNYLHGRLDERAFRIVMLVMLLLAGLALMI